MSFLHAIVQRGHEMISDLPHFDSFRLCPDPPYDATLTLDKPSGWNVFTPDERFADGTFWSVLSIDEEPTGIRIRSVGSVDDPVLEVDIYRQDPLSEQAADQIEAVLAEKFAPDIDIQAFYAKAEDDPILALPVDQFWGMYPTTGDSVFTRAVLAISLQRASLQRSRDMRRSIVKQFGTPVQFDGVTVHPYPTAERVAAMSEEELRQKCGVGYRAPYIRQTAERITEGFIDLEDLKYMRIAEARETLQQLPGIGPYSADIINPYRGCPIDSWSAEVFGKLLLNDDSVGVQEAKAAAEDRWGDWAWLAFAYVVQDLQRLSEELNMALRLE